MRIMHVHRLLRRLEPKIVGGPVNCTPFDTAAGQPHRKSERIVIAAILQGAAAAADFMHRRPAELRGGGLAFEVASGSLSAT